MGFPYSRKIMRLAASATGRGRLREPTRSACWGNPGRGPFMRLEIRIEEGAVAEAAFDANDCPVAIACGSALVELVEGRRLADLEQLGRGDLSILVGEIPPGRAHVVDIAADLLRRIASPTSESREDQS